MGLVCFIWCMKDVLLGSFSPCKISCLSSRYGHGPKRSQPVTYTAIRKRPGHGSGVSLLRERKCPLLGDGAPSRRV